MSCPRRSVDSSPVPSLCYFELSAPVVSGSPRSDQSRDSTAAVADTPAIFTQLSSQMMAPVVIIAAAVSPAVLRARTRAARNHPVVVTVVFTLMMTPCPARSRASPSVDHTAEVHATLSPYGSLRCHHVAPLEDVHVHLQHYVVPQRLHLAVVCLLVVAAAASCRYFSIRFCAK